MWVRVGPQSRSVLGPAEVLYVSRLSHCVEATRVIYPILRVSQVIVYGLKRSGGAESILAAAVDRTHRDSRAARFWTKRDVPNDADVRPFFFGLPPSSASLRARAPPQTLLLTLPRCLPTFCFFPTFSARRATGKILVQCLIYASDPALEGPTLRDFQSETCFLNRML